MRPAFKVGFPCQTPAQCRFAFTASVASQHLPGTGGHSCCCKHHCIQCQNNPSPLTCSASAFNLCSNYSKQTLAAPTLSGPLGVHSPPVISKAAENTPPNQRSSSWDTCWCNPQPQTQFQPLGCACCLLALLPVHLQQH